MKARSRQKGFTLIEVVVAFAILALSLGALYESFGGSLRRSGVASREELAVLRAESLLAEFRGSGGLLPEKRSGRDADLQADWRITAKPYPAEIAENSNWVTEFVEVEVTWGANGRKRIAIRSVELLRRPAT